MKKTLCRIINKRHLPLSIWLNCLPNQKIDRYIIIFHEIITRNKQWYLYLTFYFSLTNYKSENYCRISWFHYSQRIINIYCKNSYIIKYLRRFNRSCSVYAGHTCSRCTSSRWPCAGYSGCGHTWPCYWSTRSKRGQDCSWYGRCSC